MSDEAYVVEFTATNVESTAVGVIRPEAASWLGYETDANSPIHVFVEGILDDINNSSGYYTYRGDDFDIQIHLTRC